MIKKKGFFMGFRFRKSINLGKGFRVNLSKSGPGFSWGTKGFRLTKKAGGGFRSTAYIPGTGMSYTKDFKSFRKKPKKQGKSGAKSSPSQSQGPAGRQASPNAQGFGIDFANINSTALEDVLGQLAPVYPLRMAGLGVFILGLILTFVNTKLIFLAIAGAFMYFYKKRSGNVEIEYEFENSSGHEYDLTNKLMEGILNSDKVWLVGTIDTNKGQNIILERMDLSISQSLPKGLSTNAKVYTLACGNLSLSFLPDALLINQNGVNKAIDYNDLQVDLRAEEFLEESLVSDAHLIQKTYMYTNKSGGPDMRYKDNPEAFLVEYGVLELINNSMDLVIVFSDTSIGGN